MLEQIDTTKSLPKKAYKKRLPELQRRLFDLQRRCWEEGLGVVVVFEGWSTSGKGKAIKKLTQRLEPRAFEIHAIHAARTHESHLPWLYRFWKRLPNHGEWGIFDHSWYRRVLRERVGGSVTEAECTRAWEDISSFERTLADDRYAVIKFFLHIGAAEQEKRLADLEEDPAGDWRVRPADREQRERYDEHLVAIEHALAHTEAEWAPWTIVEAHDGRWARIKIFETLIDRLQSSLEQPPPAHEGRDGGQRVRFEPMASANDSDDGED